MSKHTVLVTGGSGFIGGVVCRLLEEAGHTVINVDRRKKEIAGVTQYPFDISNHQVDGVIKLMRPDTVIHLAADHMVGPSVTDPASYYTNNVSNTIQLLNSCVESGVKNFVFSSSSSVYGNPDVFPTPESTPLNPESPYARTKVIVEMLLQDYQRAYGLNYVSLRYFNAAGAMPGLEHGYLQDPAGHLIPIVSRACIYDTDFTVNGDDYDTVDGTPERDYTHVCDIAEAHILAMDYLNAGGTETVFNIGAGDSKTVKQVIAEFEAQGHNVKYNVANRRAGDVERTCADIQKARDLLGYEPKYKLADIVKHSFAWEKRHKRKKQ